jgi:hypothetical protein
LGTVCSLFSFAAVAGGGDKKFLISLRTFTGFPSAGSEFPGKELEHGESNLKLGKIRNGFIC